ncbi:MAG: hypothetical protein J3Q66DRAFT_190071 [Benniella sp.]|nr:MAG: hypothetical protein J3Q66DRAFT_190071 [Benniella sp.]
MAILDIFCVIEGETTSFSVEIESTKTVDRLKDAIKAKKSNYFDLMKIDAAQLTLWRVSLPDDDDLPTLLKSLNDKQKLSDFLSDKEKLKATTKLSNIFDAELPEDTIHIIVQLPQSDDERQSEAPGIMDVIKEIQNLFDLRGRWSDSVPVVSNLMPLQERSMDEAIDTVIENVISYSAWEEHGQVAKTESSFLVCSGTAGIGKTRFGRELSNALRNGLSAAAKAKNVDYSPRHYYMLLDFSNGVNLTPGEERIAAEVILGLRLVYYHFFRGKYTQVFPSFVFQALKLNRSGLFTIDNVVGAIRQDLELPDEQALFLFLHIDEFQKIFDYGWKGSPKGSQAILPDDNSIQLAGTGTEHHTREGLSLFKDMTRSLGSYMSGVAKPSMIQTFLSGTARHEVTRAAEPTSYSFKFLSCPTLSIGACYDIMGYFTERASVPFSDWMPKLGIFRLLSATGGLPRALQILLENLFGRTLDECQAFAGRVNDFDNNADQTFTTVAHRLDEHYRVRDFAETHRDIAHELMRLCILETPSLRTQLLSNRFTLDALERDTHTILEDSKEYGKVLVRIPYFFLYLYNTVTQDVGSLLSSAFLKNWEQLQGWRFFETLIAEYEVFRTNLIIGGGSKTASLKEIYQGAFGRTETLDRTVNLRELTHVKADHRFPENGPLVVKKEAKAWDSNMVIENAAGAKFGDVCVCRTGAGAGSDKILFALQAKKLADDETVSFNLIQEEHRKNLATIGSVPPGSILNQQGIRDAKVITVVITTADFKDQNLDGQSIPEDCLLVCRRNFTEFFGDAFGLPIALSLSKDRNWNFATPEALRKRKLDEKVVSQILENIPYRSHEELIRKVPALSSEELDEGMGFLPYERLAKMRRVG